MKKKHKIFLYKKKRKEYSRAETKTKKYSIFETKNKIKTNNISDIENFLSFTQLIRQPVQTFVQTMTLGSASCLYVPLAIAHIVQA